MARTEGAHEIEVACVETDESTSTTIHRMHEEGLDLIEHPELWENGDGTRQAGVAAVWRDTAAIAFVLKLADYENDRQKTLVGIAGVWNGEGGDICRALRERAESGAKTQ